MTMISNSGHVMTLANSIIGVGILAMPFCFQKCGIILSILLLILNNFITRVSCHYLIKSSLLTRRKSFEFLGFHAFGSFGKLLVELCIIGYLIGSCITYFVVVGDVGPQIVTKIFNVDGTNSLRIWVMIIVTIFCILPLGMLKNVDSLSAVCTASVGFYVCLVVKIIIESQAHILANDWQGEIAYWEPSGVLQCLPIFSMALSCQMQLFEVLESVNNQSLEKLNTIVKNATWMCTVVYIAVGFFGYVAFCTHTFSGNILVNFAPTFGSDVIKIGFVLSVAFSFPLVIFPCRASIYSLLYRRGHADTTGYIPEARFKSITAIIVIGSLCIALLIPSIELVIGLVGSTIGVAICVIFPAACFRKISKKDSTERTLGQAIIVGGCCLMILGTYANLSAIDEKRFGAPQISLESVTRPTTPLPLFDNNFDKPKEVVKEIPLRNLSLSSDLKISEKISDPLSVEQNIQAPVRVEKVEEKAKTSPPLPVDEVEQEAEKSPEVNPPEKAAIGPTPVVEVVPLASEVPPLKPSPNPNSIDKEAIKKDEEIAAEEQQQKEADKQEQLTKAENELKKTKELLERKVDELKEELAKQNKETQDLVVKKFGQVVEKVEQIEREVHKDSQIEGQGIANVDQPIEVPKASILGLLTENRKTNATKEKAKEPVYEPLSYKTGEIAKKIYDAVNPSDLRLPLPLPLLINASQSQMLSEIKPKQEPSKPAKQIAAEGNHQKPPIAEVIPISDSTKKTEIKITEAPKSKLPVDEVERHIVPQNGSPPALPQSKSTEAAVKKNSAIENEMEKENIEAIRRDILEVNKDHKDLMTTLKASREKRSASDIDFEKINMKLEQENCLNNVKVETLLGNTGLDTKLQGLGRDLKSVTDEE